MSLADLAGYRWVIEAQYDTLFRDARSDDPQAALDALAPFLARVRAALAPSAPDALLDLGCGAGLASVDLARAFPDARVVGVDVSAHALALARENAHRTDARNATFVHADAETPPGGPFDGALALSVFNLMPDKEAALRAWRSALRPGARLALADAFAREGPGTRGAGAMEASEFVALARTCGWRVVAHEDLTDLVRALHARGAWAWSEYLRDGFVYMLWTLEADALT